MITATTNWQAAAALYQQGGGAKPVLLLTIGKASLTDAGGYPRILSNSKAFPGYYPWLKLDSVDLSQSLNDLEGSSNLSSVSIPCLDGDLLDPRAISTDIANGYSFPGKTAMVWYGWQGLALSDFCLLATMIVDHSDYEESANVLTFVLRDNSLLANGYAFIYAQNGALTSSQNPATVQGRPFDPAQGLVVSALDEAGFSSGLINTSSLEYLDQNIYFDLNMAFTVSYPPVAKDWIENEILKALGCYWYWNNAGQFTAASLLPAAPPTTALALAQGDIALDTFPTPIESEMYTSALTYRMDCDSNGQNPQTNFTNIYAPAANLYGISQSRVIVSRGLRSGQGGMRMAHLMANMLFRRYGLKPLTLKIKGFALCLRLEMGDKLLINHPLVPNGKFPAALRTPGSALGIHGTLWEVLKTSKSLEDSTVDLELLHVSWQLATNSWLIAPDGTPAYASASSVQRAKYFFVCNSSDQQSNGTQRIRFGSQMSFTLAEPPGLTDVPESLMTADQSVASGFVMSAIKDNCASGTVSPEFFQGFYTHGQTVALPQSPADNYQYARSELRYVWEIANTTNMSNGLPSQPGGLLWLRPYVDQATGIVNIEEYYYVEGGGGAPSNDGVLIVTAIGVRGMQFRKFTATIPGSLTSGTFVAGERMIQTATGATAYLDPGSAIPGSGVPLTILQAVMSAPDSFHTWTGQTSGAVWTPTGYPTNYVNKYSIAGTLTSGTFQIGETATQATTGAAGIVTYDLPGSKLILIGLSAAADASHHWTGGTSGAVFTPSASPVFISAKYSDLAASDFGVDAPLAQTLLRDLSNNAKLANVRMECFLMNPSRAAVWTPGATHSAGDLVQPTGKWANGCWYVAANSGASGQIEPGPWPSIPENTTQVDDGSIIWNIAGAGFGFGQEVPLPVSPVDGYEYSAAEIYAVMPFYYTTLAYPVQKGVNIVWTSGKGDIRALAKDILATAPNSVSQLPNGTQPADTTGATIYTNWNFTSTPPAEIHEPALATPGTATSGCGYVYNSVWFSNAPYSDGALFVLVIACRALGGTLASPGGATFVDFSTDDVLSGQPLPNTVAGYINENAKFSILRPELGMEFSATPGSAVPVAASPWDSYSYQPSECQYLYWWTNTGAAPGQLRDFSVDVEPLTGVLNTRTDYFRNSSIATNMKGYSGSPVYSNMPGGGPWGLPTVDVAVIESRLHEVELQAQQLLIPNSEPEPPGPDNLLPNGGFEIQRVTGGSAVAIAGVALDWYVIEEVGTTAFLEETGLAAGSNFAQGDGANCTASTLSGRSTNAVNRGSFGSTIIPIDPNGTYQFDFLAKASPNVINYGFYCRVHLLDENLANDTAFDLLWPNRGSSDILTAPGIGLSNNPGSPLSASAVNDFGPFVFAIPPSGATAVQTGFGLSVLCQGGTTVSLGFLPAFLWIEFDVWSPIYSGWSSGTLVLFAIIDNCFLKNVTGVSTAPVNAAQQLTSPATLAQVSTTTVIDVSASTVSFPNLMANYGSGSVDPGAFGTWWVYAVDPNYNGGSVTYLATQNRSDLSAQLGIVIFGSITTYPAGGGTGGGGTGGGTQPTIATTYLNVGTHAVAYSDQLLAYGGTSPYTWSLAGGSLPSGITLSSGGLLSGTTLSTGYYPLTISIADSSTPTQTASRSLILIVQ